MSVSTRREREKEQRREDILQAAREVFLRSGFQGTTMGEVAKEAELSKGTLYLYFKSKFELYVELSNRVCSNILTGFVQIAETSLNGRLMVGEMLTHWVEVSSHDLKTFRVAVGFVASEEKPDQSAALTCHNETISKIIEQLAGAVQRGQEDGSILRKVDSVTMACQLWSAMVGAMLFYSRNQVLMEGKTFIVDAENFMSNQIKLMCAGLGVK